MSLTIRKTISFKRSSPKDVMTALLAESWGADAASKVLDEPFGTHSIVKNISLPKGDDGPSLLVQTMKDPAWKHESTVAFHVIPDGKLGCDLHFTHTGVPEDARDNLETGWAKRFSAMTEEDEKAPNKKPRAAPLGIMEHVELPVKDMERASKFWSELCSWSVQEMGPPFDGAKYRFWTLDHQKSARGGLTTDETHPVPYITTEDMDDFLERVVKAGGVVVEPKEAVGEFGWKAAFTCSEGARYGVWSNAPGQA